MSKTSRKKGDQAEVLVEAIRSAIIEGRLKPDQALRQEEIAAEFETSRMPVRDALRILNLQGLVRLVPNKGAVVAPIDANELVENTEMREAAELLALGLAIPQLSNAQIDTAAHVQREIEGAELHEFGNLNKRFHMAVYAPCNRPRLLAHISNLHDIAERYMCFALENLDYVQRSTDEHHRLIEACFNRDKASAETVLRSHIADAGKALLTYLER
jgi:DNA-binding GntR family transcriptional regulator